MEYTEETWLAIRSLFATESGEPLTRPEWPALLECIENNLDCDQSPETGQLRAAVQEYLRQTRVCEHAISQPGHPEYDGQRCCACDRLEYADRLCDERRGT